MDIKTIKTKELESQKWILDGYKERILFLEKAMEHDSKDYETGKKNIIDRIQMAKAMAKVSSRIQELEELLATL